MKEDDKLPWESQTSQAAWEFASRCTALYIQNPYSEPLLMSIINTLMTELWDMGFSQTEIRTAFKAAIEDMPRYAAGEERNGGAMEFRKK